MSWKKKFKKFAGVALGGLGPIGMGVGALLNRGSRREVRNLEDQLTAAPGAYQQQSLQEEMGAYKNLPETLRTSQTQAAKNAGTFSDTPEFNAGLTSDVNAQTRGARSASVARMNAIRKKLGLPEGDENFYNTLNA